MKIMPKMKTQNIVIRIIWTIIFSILCYTLFVFIGIEIPWSIPTHIIIIVSAIISVIGGIVLNVLIRYCKNSRGEKHNEIDRRMVRTSMDMDMDKRIRHGSIKNHVIF